MIDWAEAQITAPATAQSRHRVLAQTSPQTCRIHARPPQHPPLAVVPSLLAALRSIVTVAPLNVEMIEATRRWFRRNRTNILVGAGVVGAGYLAGQYVWGKIQEARQRMGEDRIAKENLRRRFQQNQEDCRYTVLALLPTVRDEIMGALPVEQITEQLQQERQERVKRLGASEAASSELPSGPPSTTDDASSLQSGSFIHASQVAGSSAEGSGLFARPKRSKAQLWQEMKINSITRALTLIYTLSLLTLLTRIQLNLLGRRTYLSSVVALASPPMATEESTISLENKDDDNYDNVYGSDFDTNRKYLTFSWWLLHRGSKEIMSKVMAAVQEVFGPVNIREDISFERLGDLIMMVRKKVEGATEQDRRQMQWLQYLLPLRQDEAFVLRQSGMSESEDSPSSEERAAAEDPLSTSASDTEPVSSSLRRLLDETSDLIDSPTFTHVLTRLLDTSFSHLVDDNLAAKAFRTTSPEASVEQSRVTEVVDKCKVAHVLPIFCQQAHLIAAGSGELDPLTAISAQDALKNEYMDVIDQVHDLEAFAAVIYSSNFEYEVTGNTDTTAPQLEGMRVLQTQPLPSHLPVGPEEVAPVEKTERRTTAEANLEGSEAPLPAEAAGESARSGTEQAASSDEFESAWKKALADEDGKEAVQDK